MTREEIEVALGEPTLDVTHFGNGVLVGTVADDTGVFAIASDGTSTSYEEFDSLPRARRATTRLAMSHVLNDCPIFR